MQRVSNRSAVACTRHTNVRRTSCPDDAFSTMAESNALRKIYERRAWLGCHGDLDAPHVMRSIRRRSGADMWALFTPYYPCRWSLEKEPSAEVTHDGGKVCSPGPP